MALTRSEIIYFYNIFIYPPRTENKPKKHAVFPKFELIFNYNCWTDKLGWQFFCGFMYIDLFATESALHHRLLAKAFGSLD